MYVSTYKFGCVRTADHRVEMANDKPAYMSSKTHENHMHLRRQMALCEYVKKCIHVMHYVCRVMCISVYMREVSGIHADLKGNHLLNLVHICIHRYTLLVLDPWRLIGTLHKKKA